MCACVCVAMRVERVLMVCVASARVCSATIKIKKRHTRQKSLSKCLPNCPDPHARSHMWHFHLQQLRQLLLHPALPLQGRLEELPVQDNLQVKKSF